MIIIIILMIMIIINVTYIRFLLSPYFDLGFDMITS